MKISIFPQYCENGPVVDVIRKIQVTNRRVSEEQIAYILRETAKALIYLHENHIIHRDVRGHNILLTRDGEVKLCDFGLSRDIKSTLGKRGTCIGSPCWMAPEIITSGKNGRYLLRQLIAELTSVYHLQTTKSTTTGRTCGRWELRRSNWAMASLRFTRCTQRGSCSRSCVIHRRRCIDRPTGPRTTTILSTSVWRRIRTIDPFRWRSSSIRS